MRSENLTNWFGNPPKIYPHDPFYQAIERLSGKEKATVYRELSRSAVSYSAFALLNTSKSDEYDLRITANCGLRDLDTNTLNSSGILVEQVLPDSVRLKVPYLATGPTNYKFLVFRRSGENTGPVKKELIRLDAKSLITRITDHYVALLIGTIALTVIDGIIAYQKRQRKAATVRQTAS